MHSWGLSHLGDCCAAVGAPHHEESRLAPASLYCCNASSILDGKYPAFTRFEFARKHVLGFRRFVPYLSSFQSLHSSNMIVMTHLQQRRSAIQHCRLRHCILATQPPSGRPLENIICQSLIPAGTNCAYISEWVGRQVGRWAYSHVSTHNSTFVCIYVYAYACMHVCMYACISSSSVPLVHARMGQ